MSGDAANVIGDRAQSRVRLPDIDADRCVHGLCATASCRKCADACPASALVIDDEALGIDAEACDGCGLCAPACPEGAITFATGTLQPLLAEGDRVALVACELAGLPSGRGVVACLHAIGDRDVIALVDRGCGSIVAASGECAACARHTTATLQAAVDRANRLRASLAQPPVAFVVLGASEWDRRRAGAAAPRSSVDEGRRALFGLRGRSLLPDRSTTVSANPPAVQRLFRFVPVIDATACTGCDACARLCPHRAIELGRGGDGRLAYSLSGERCTGCGLCVDVCETRAVGIVEMSRVEQALLPLEEHQCRHCGVPFHMPVLPSAHDKAQTSPTGDGVCGICRATGRTRTLFQVRK